MEKKKKEEREEIKKLTQKRWFRRNARVAGTFVELDSGTHWAMSHQGSYDEELLDFRFSLLKITHRMSCVNLATIRPMGVESIHLRGAPRTDVVKRS
jgi:hypothetical protein